VKVAVISDIHGNLYALERVLDQIDHEGPYQIVCLGDVIAFGPQPVDVLHRIRTLGCPVVMGNCDDFFVRWPLPEEDNLNYARVKWAAEQLSPEDIAFMASFRPAVSVPLENGESLLCFHGSPRSNTEIILAGMPEEELAGLLDDAHATVMIGGHTHLQMIRRLPHTLLVNAGSIGMPSSPGDRSHFMPWAEWAEIEATDSGLDVELRRTFLNTAELKARAAASTMPGIKEWLAAR
jgi:putative phosphoesterase